MGERGSASARRERRPAETARGSRTDPNDAVLRASREELAVRAERGRADVVVRLGAGRLVEKNAVGEDEARGQPLPSGTDKRGEERGTHAILAPVLVSYSVVLRLQPVARTLPSGEKRTQQTTLREKEDPR